MLCYGNKFIHSFIHSYIHSFISNFIKDIVIGKAAGPDNLTAEYLKHAHKTFLFCYHYVFPHVCHMGFYELPSWILLFFPLLKTNVLIYLIVTIIGLWQFIMYVLKYLNMLFYNYVRITCGLLIISLVSKLGLELICVFRLFENLLNIIKLVVLPCL